jgi:hypothetical protein
MRARNTTIRQAAPDEAAHQSGAVQSLGHYTPLFPLPVFGTGTAMVEGLPSYLHRLSGAHGLPLTTLLTHTILPAMGANYAASGCGSLITGRRGTRLLFSTTVSLDLIKILPQLTGQSSFDQCISSNLQTAFSFKRDVRGVWSWCPLCLEQWIHESKPIYFPVIWNLTPYHICTDHLVALLTACPRCGLRYPLVRRDVWTIECRRCGALQIGATALANNPSAVDPSNWDWKTSVRTKEILEWAANKREIPTQIFKENLSTLLSESISFESLTKSLGISYQTVQKWKHNVCKPRLLSVINLSINLGIPVQDFYESHLIGIDHPQSTPRPKLYPPRISGNWKTIEAALRDALNPLSTESISLAKICVKFGASRPAIFRRFPELSAAVVKKYQDISRANLTQNRKRREARLEQLLLELKQQGQAANRYFLRMLMKSRGEGQTFQILKLFKERSKTRRPCN